MASEKTKAAIGGAVPLKFVQISTTAVGSGGDTEFEIFGLTVDGSVHRYCVGREPLKEEREITLPNGLKTKTWYGPSYSWWQPLRMSTEKGAEYEAPATPKEFL